MNNEVIEDLKQFIKATVSQTEARLGQRIDGLTTRVDNLTHETHAGFAGVAEVIEAQAEDVNARFDAQQAQLDAHTKQLSKLSR